MEQMVVKRVSRYIVGGRLISSNTNTSCRPTHLITEATTGKSRHGIPLRTVRARSGQLEVFEVWQETWKLAK